MIQSTRDIQSELADLDIPSAKDITNLWERTDKEVASFVKRKPYAAIGVAVAAGWLAARVLGRRRSS